MAREVASICPYCGVGCGIRLQVDAGRVVGLRPDAAHPVSRGSLCPKGATAHEFVHHPDRLARPLVRRGDRLVPASWEEALAFVATGLRRVIDEHGPDAVAVISSARATVEENWLAQKFARAVLRTNQVDNCYRICHSATVEGLARSIGSGAMTNSIREIEGARTVLLVGSNVAHSHPIVWTVWMKPAVDAGAHLVVVDPRATIAAKQAEVHLRARPGTDVWLFNALAHVILENGWVDEAFLRDRCEGLDALRAHVAAYAPEAVAARVGVAAGDIRRAAEVYATNAPAMIVYGLGVTEHRNGVDAVRALANLALLTGNVGKPSSGINALRGQNDVQGATDMCRPETLPGYQSWSDADAVARFEGAWGVPLPRPSTDWLWCSRMWERALEGELKALYVIGSDPALTEAHTEKVRRALESLDLLVVQDLFPSSTTRLAHVVLPACSYAEKDGTYVNTERRIQRVRKAIEPLGESRSDGEILMDLARLLGAPIGDGGPERVFDEVRRLVPSYAGVTYARLEGDGLQWPVPDEAHPGTPILHEGNFAIGRARLAVVEGLPPSEEPDAEYPLLLTTGRSFMQYNCGTNSRRTRMEKGEPRAILLIHEDDAARVGVRDGDRVRVVTRRGMVEVEARCSDIAPGVVWMPFHYVESPANALTNPVVDPECGITELKACSARVEPAR